MVIQGKEYGAKGGPTSAIEDTETAAFSKDIAEAISRHLGVTKRKSAPMLLYKGDQFERGDPVMRPKLQNVLAQFIEL